MTTVLDSSPEVIVFALDKDYRYIAFNSLHKSIIRRIWGCDIEIGMSMLDVIKKDEDRASAKANFDRALGGEHFVLMEEYGAESLSRLCWLDYYSPLLSHSGEVVGLTCFVLNHTERKQAEDKVVKLLQEKEIILKEVHHRIKNNMNTMMSLLSVHAARLKDPAAVAAMGNAQSLMRSMGVLYDKLYQTQNLVDMSVNDYFPSLVGEIVRVLPTTARIMPVVLVEDFRLGVKDLSTLGIVVNELVTNAGKYAFVGREEGKIFLTAVKRENRIVITIGDDGVGMETSRLEEVQAMLDECDSRISPSALADAGITPANLSGNGIALQNTHYRLRLIYGAPYGLRISSRKGVGTEVVVRIPITKMEAR